MNSISRRHLVLEPILGYSPEIGQWLWALEDTRHRTLSVFDGMVVNTASILDWVSPVNGNSIGTLLYHLAAVEASWLYEEVLQADFPPDIAELLPYDMRDGQNHLSSVKGTTVQEHLFRLQQIRAKLRSVYSEMTLEDFLRARSLPEYDVTPQWVLHHLMQHEGEHRGQITELRLSAEQAFQL